MINNPLPRLDKINKNLKQELLQYCRLKPGEIWVDPLHQHKVGCLDAAQAAHVKQLMGQEAANLAIHDPPYNLVTFKQRGIEEYITWCRKWIRNTWDVLAQDSACYLWLGADQRNHFQPLPDFMIMMREFPFEPRSFMTMRNQRGYGTQYNWMAVRQELLYYIKGNPLFDVQYTEIPKRVGGYYKQINGKLTNNLERGKSKTIRPGNVWFDIQQIFYRLEENVSGCYAQKPLKAYERIIHASSRPHELVIDFFSHSGTTLIASELTQRRCFTIDIDPLYCELTIRRLEQLRKTGKTGWQNCNPFEKDAPQRE